MEFLWLLVFALFWAFYLLLKSKNLHQISYIIEKSIENSTESVQTDLHKHYKHLQTDSKLIHSKTILIHNQVIDLQITDTHITWSLSTLDGTTTHSTPIVFSIDGCYLPEHNVTLRNTTECELFINYLYNSINKYTLWS